MIDFLLRCSGDLSKDLEDFQILSIEIYNGRKKQEKALYESLVPVMFAKDYEDIAEQFLRDVYPKALVNNTPPDPRDIASKLGLTVMERSITDDYSIFGQIYFRDTDTELYNKKKEIMEPVHSAGSLTAPIQNQSGTVLPSTGGIGTTIFYILGGLLVVGAAVILVARRKAQD